MMAIVWARELELIFSPREENKFVYEAQHAHRRWLNGRIEDQSYPVAVKTFVNMVVDDPRILVSEKARREAH